MSEQENLDIGRVISLIMENPALIEQISNLAKGTGGTTSTEAVENSSATAEAPTSSTPAPTYSPARDTRNNRARLLGAFKPYVSEERAKAIDSMISIADILDMMKAR